jgi:hypothetical protein
LTGPDLHPLRPLDYRLALALALVLLVLGGWRTVPRVTGVFHDDAIYVITAKALAEGHGYRLINLPGAPRQTKYPILYPAMLAVIWKIWPVFPDNLLAMQAVTLLSAAAAFALTYLFLVRFGYCSRLTAAVSVLLCGTTPTVVYMSTITLSEMTFALLVIAALWRVELDLHHPPRSAAGQFATGIILASPYLCRTIGLPVVLAAVALLLWHRKPVRWVLVGVAVIVAPWLTWTFEPTVRWRDDPIVGYYTDYGAGWSFFNLQALRVTVINLILICRDTVGIVLTGLHVAVGAAARGLLQWLALPGAVAWIYILWKCRRMRLLPWCLVTYTATVALWPWPPWRFLVPILPLLVSEVSQAFGMVIGPFFPRGRHRYVLAGIALVAFAANMTLGIIAGRVSHQAGYPYQLALGTTDERVPVSWSSFTETFEWMRSHVREDEVVAGGLDPMLYLYTGRQAFRPWVHRPEALFYGSSLPKVGSPDEFVTILRSHGARYLVMLPLNFFSEQKPIVDVVRQVQEHYPALLVPVYQGADPRFKVFEITIRGSGGSR